MPPRHHFRHDPTSQTHEESQGVCKLWLLRMLVPLGAQRNFIKRHGFASDKLAQILGLGRWIEDEPAHESWDISDDQEDEIDVGEDPDESTGTWKHNQIILTLHV